MNNIDTFLDNIDNKIEYVEIEKYTDLEIKPEKDISSYIKNKKNIHCGNCGKKGHIYKKCHFPIMSMGIICIKLDEFNINDIINGKCEITKFKTIKSVDKYLNSNLRFLLVRRKHSLGFVEFIRGKYEFDNFEYLLNILNIMSKDEIKLLQNNSFDVLWNNLWSIDASTKNHRTEYNNSFTKFNRLKKGVYIKFNKKLRFKIKLDDILNNTKSKWVEPEWGFPKGRRNLKENDLNCAIREFNEETNYMKDDYDLIDINPSYERFIGTNGVRYQHIYYLAQIKTNKEPFIDENNQEQMCEIGDMKWISYKEAYSKIREYNYDKKVKMESIYNMIKYMLLYNNISNENNEECLFE